MKIYLIDDTSKKEMNAEFVLENKYQDILSVIENRQKLDEEMNHIEDADCILVHYTFCNSNIAMEDMKEIADDGDKIPLVIFSGGSSVEFAKVEGGCISSLKKSTMYARLKAFLDDAIETNEINLRILAEGEDYIKEDIKKWGMSLLSLLSGQSGIIDEATVMLLKEHGALHSIVEASQPRINITFDDLIASLHKRSIEKIISNVNKIIISFSQYGKNIYPWE